MIIKTILKLDKQKKLPICGNEIKFHSIFVNKSSNFIKIKELMISKNQLLILKIKVFENFNRKNVEIFNYNYENPKISKFKSIESADRYIIRNFTFLKREFTRLLIDNI